MSLKSKYTPTLSWVEYCMPQVQRMSNNSEFMPVKQLLPVVLPSGTSVFVNDYFLFIIKLIYIHIIKFRNYNTITLPNLYASLDKKDILWAVD